MPINSNIPLQAQTPPMQDPIQTLGQMAQFRSYQQMNQQRDLMNETKRRQLEDDTAIRDAAAQFPRPEDAIEHLYKTRPSAAGTLSKQVFEYRDAQAKALKDNLANTSTKIGIATNIAKGITDLNSLNTGRKAIEAAGGPEIAAMLPATYDKAAIDALVNQGTDLKTSLDEHQRGIDNAWKANDFMRNAANDLETHTAARMAAIPGQVKAASGLLSLAKTPEQWQGNMDLLSQGGYGPEVLGQFGEWAPDAPARAAKLGITPVERASQANAAANTAGAAAGRAETKRHNLITEGQAAEGGAPGTGRGRSLTVNAESEITTRQKSAHAKLQEKIDSEGKETKGTDGTWYPADTNVLKLPKGVTLTSETRIPEEVKAQYAPRKVAIEDAYRAERGMPSYLQSEIQFATDPTKSKELRILRNKYKMLTNQQMPMERLAKLKEEGLKTKDPDRLEAIRQEVADLRDQIRAAGGR